MMKSRYIEKPVKEICFKGHKMTFISGPRQTGKTTFAKQLLKKRGMGQYHNWDELKFRRQWTKDPASVATSGSGETVPLAILDEIHKAKGWKRNLKGVFDTLEEPLDILVTGSARLNVYRKGSDSLLGRYYHFRLHPFSLAELIVRNDDLEPDELINALTKRSYKGNQTSCETLKRLLTFGPFPEPYLSSNKHTLQLWQSNRVERIIREDLRDLSHIPELSQIEMLASLLPERVGSLLSITSLAEDLETSYTTVKRWLSYLSELYYCYSIKPYIGSIKRSLRKTPKLYLWDWSEVEDESIRFENLVASHLLKYVHYLVDTGCGKYQLRYVRNKEKKEIDFLIAKDNAPWLPIEVKYQQEKISPNWRGLMNELNCKFGIQVIKKPGVYQLYQLENCEILLISADEFLKYLI